MSINLVQSRVTTGGGTSLAATLPSGVIKDNLLVAVVMVGNNASAITPPSGWTQAVINQPAGTNATIETAIFYKIVDASSAGQTSWTWSLAVSHSMVICIEEWHATNGWLPSPVDKTAQGDTVATPVQATLIDSGTTAATTQAEELWIAGLSYKSSSLQTESSITAGWTKDVEAITGSVNVGSALYKIAAATGTANCNYTITTASWWSGAVATFKTSVGPQLQPRISGTGVITSSLTLPPPPPLPLATLRPVTASYAVRVRGPDLLSRGQITTYRRLSIVKRFNNVSDWAIELDADDPVASLLTQPGYGLTVIRSIYDPPTGKVISSRVEITGPMMGIQRKMSDNSLTVHGKDDLVYLASLDAWPSPQYKYSVYVNTMPGLLRYYRLTDTGTTAVDSKSAQSGTYTGTYTQSQPAIIDDPNSSIILDGTSGRISLPTTGLPTGNAVYWMAAWINAASFTDAGGFKFAAAFGTNTPSQATWIGADSSGRPACGNFNTTLRNTGISIATGTAHLITQTYDGTTRKLYLDGVMIASDTPGAQSITLGTAYIGCNVNATQFFWNGGMDEVMIGSGSLPTDAQILQLYTLGLSRHNYQAYDAQSGAAETVLKHYVTYNAGSIAYAERQIAGLTVEADTALGATVSESARFDKLINSDGTGLLQRVALNGGDLGFAVNTSNGAMSFHVYQPTDRSNSIIFSEDLGNLLDFSYGVEAPDPFSGGNVQTVGGTGEGVNRLFETVSDSTSVGTWWRTENFVDARDTSDLNVLQQRGQAALGDSKGTTTFDVTLAPETLQLVYGRDFNLGDKVTAVIDGAPFVDLIRELDIDLKAGSSEVITPKMGTPNAVRIKDALLRFQRQARKSSSALRKTQTAQ